MKEIMIKMIKVYQYYEDGVLEELTEAEVKEVYESLIDWI